MSNEDGDPVPRQMVVRRRWAPRYRTFGGTGALIGVAVGMTIALSEPADDGYSMGTVIGYFAVGLGLIGALLGLGIAVLLERRR